MPPKVEKRNQRREIKFAAGGSGQGFNGFKQLTPRSKMAFQIKDAEVGFALAVRMEQHGGEIDHQEGEVDGVGDGLLGHVHEVLQSPVLFGIVEGKLNLKA